MKYLLILIVLFSSCIDSELYQCEIKAHNIEGDTIIKDGYNTSVLYFKKGEIFYIGITNEKYSLDSAFCK